MQPQIEEIVCRHFGITKEDLYGKSRVRNTLEAKQYVWYFLRVMFSYRIRVIAKHYDLTPRNMAYSIAKIRDGIRNQKYYYDHYITLINEIKKEDIDYYD